MRSDQYRNIVLTVIAVCLSALTLTGIGLSGSPALAEATVGAADSDAYQKRGSETAGPRAATSTLPLRWKVPVAHEDVMSDATYCSTVVSVLNLTGKAINVDVEWMKFDGASSALRPMLLPAEDMLQWVTNDVINLNPYYIDDDANLPVLLGYANVNADDPRILVTATILCRDGTATGARILSQNEVPAFPMGATADYFTAGMPRTWAPPVAAPELPR